MQMDVNLMRAAHFRGRAAPAERSASSSQSESGSGGYCSAEPGQREGDVVTSGSS